MNKVNKQLAYVVGDCYSELTRLPGIFTATQFFTSIFDGSLPKNLTWIMGQGLNNTEENLLRLCQNYQSEIKFYNHVSYVEENNHYSILLKLSQIMKVIGQRLGFYR